ncbi:MAG: hypothetical protein A2W93_13570 [Bacteroidetes bacterium GWF2_43_63]|nr:MAG: hypothetical protein A2W94_03765 [Bacteroidetes bacterium GWE2_42_42]OFY55019.1 MAG: hypothetical protein A2W93_13570 [Bacteroidetes bacterium GWF2_43_63]HBG69554.1 hemolysin [Bacteroidales bacterium]HCB60707.1 hemolysin [Bacteroidales bacterium]HCY23989.1 hemolysin [Bacteroidales bacterium]
MAFIILLLLLLNGVFAMFEIAMVSSRRARLQERASRGSNGAKTALKLLNDPDKMFSAIQVGITLIGIVNGALSGISFADDLAPHIASIHGLENYAPTLSMLIVIGLITYLSLIIGELVPKSLAMNNAEPIAIFLSPPMNLLRRVMYPVVMLLSVSTKLILKLAGVKNRNEPPVTDEELRFMLKIGSESGVFNKEESVLMNEVLRFGDKKASQVMTQRRDIDYIDLKASVEEILEAAEKTVFSRLLVIDKTIDNIAGVVSVRDIHTQYISKKIVLLNDLITDPVFIPEQMLAIRVIDLFQRLKNHFGVVVDEYGTMSGIVTLHDLIENIMGDLPLLDDVYEPELIQREDGSWLADGAMLWSELAEKLNVKVPSGEEELLSGINTLGGYAMVKLNKIPSAGDVFHAAGFRFEIMDMDGKRVDKMLISSQ